MSYKHLISSIFAFIFCSTLVAQIPKKHYKWRHLGPASIPISNADSLDWSSTGIGWIEDLCIGKTWFVGSITGGLYKSTNLGKSWKKADKDTMQMGTLCIEESRGTLFRGTGLTHYDEKFGLGILKSTNNGKTWKPTGLIFKGTDAKPIWAIKASEQDSTIIACSPNSIFTSIDFGSSWKETHSETKGDFRSIVYSNGTENTIFVGGAHLLVSSNGGVNWRDITNKLSLFRGKEKLKRNSIQRIAICADPNKKGRVLALYSFNNEVILDESRDNGESWTKLYSTYKIRRIDINHAEIGIAPGNSKCIVIGGIRTFISTDNAKSFNQVTFPFYQSNKFAHDDIRGLHLKSTNEFFIATDGGLFTTKDTGNTWVNVSGKGLNVMQIYGLELLNNGSVVVGCQDLGTFIVRNKEWLNVAHLYGDGGDDLEYKDRLITMMSGTLRSTDMDSFKTSKYFHPARGGNPFTAKLYDHPKSTDSFFYVGTTLWQYSGSSWVDLANSLDGKNYKATGFDVNYSNPNQLLFAFDQPTWNGGNLSGKFFRSLDYGQNWQDITSKLPILAWKGITSICSNPNNPNEIYVSLGIMDRDVVHKVYKSKDGGESWLNFSDGLPPFETFKIMHIQNSTGVLVSTLKGLYYRNGNMDKWQLLKGRIPNIAIRDFEFYLEKRVLYAGTYGNGLWKLKLPKKMLKF